MYLGEKKMNISAVDNGIVAAVAPKVEAEALFVPEAWGQEVSAAVAETVEAPVTAGTDWSAEPSLVEKAETKTKAKAGSVLIVT